MRSSAHREGLKFEGSPVEETGFEPSVPPKSYCVSNREFLSSCGSLRRFRFLRKPSSNGFRKDDYPATRSPAAQEIEIKGVFRRARARLKKSRGIRPRRVHSRGRHKTPTTSRPG
jgi:hypothetical protein